MFNGIYMVQMLDLVMRGVGVSDMPHNLACDGIYVYLLNFFSF